VAKGEKGFAICPLRTIGGEVEARKVGRDVYWFMNCGVLALLCVPWELILGHDTYHEI